MLRTPSHLIRTRIFSTAAHAHPQFQMDVTKKTFKETLPKVQAAISSCDFIAIDTELTGLHKTAAESASFADTPQLRYDKLRSSSQNFAVIQFGVSTFTWDATVKKYVSRSFNFPIFPSAGRALLGLDRRFLVESSAVDFLLQNNFDFNETFQNGIPYVRYDEESAARIKINGVEAPSSNIMTIEDKDREYVETAMSDVQEWLQNSTEPYVSITAENGFKKRLIHQEVRIRFNHFLGTRSRGRDVQVSKLNETERARAMSGEDEFKYKLIGELEYLIGFRSVIDMISKSRKPVVGHNMYLDLCQTIQKFCFELPEAVAEFKTLCHNIFPTIYDTKHIANTDTKILALVSNSTLSEMSSRLAIEIREPKIVCHPDFRDYANGQNDKFHEAAFDAFSTGAAFLRMIYHIAGLGSGERLDFAALVDEETTPASADSATPTASQETLKRFLNKLNVMRSDEPVLNLVGDSDTINRSHLLHVSNFPSAWKTHTLISVAYPLFGNVMVRWLGPTACFVVAMDRTRIGADSVDDLLVALEERAGVKGCRVLLHDDYIAMEAKAADGGSAIETAVSGESSRKRARSNSDDEEAEDGEILEDGEEDETEMEGQRAKRPKSEGSCIIS
ncbi:ribonuclease H-like domain-containing protein [Chytriomyces cf. hyalinus JEL632]|nr:ribonuclease H-like domain-containing protein [Chytriomyces cf. hyalinus JEL632]